ncbi:hypothetical protein AD006_30855 (plasmid) [Pseudonocardia sp. EC080610-09]|uniref:hypothetical protein n=1 Tax=unclassified Pseudonocardia TaxID=2619320 RepID=UPI000705803B|nr:MULTISPECIES: hypothetical protein [unclassified Pseudonocardia]ALL79603.1 hypothetical protein AD006_30855 [Pseudonocardia sp. EC080610-09]ALL85442.1 hypothetical protein AD017_30380 [Pseudonocardia sp. EC080619-01]
MTVPAHGIGTRSDLPVPIGPAAAAAAAALIISFVVLALLWRRPRVTGPGRPLPARLAAAVEHPALRTVLRAVTLAGVAVVVLVGFLGPAEASDNLAPWALYVTFWAGLVPASLVAGPVVRLVNPLRLLHPLLVRLLRVPPTGLRPLPGRLGYWPAAGSLLAFAWLELVAPGRSDPTWVAAFVAGYAVVHVGAAVVFGRTWFDRGDGFEVYSTLLGSLAPIGRSVDGRLGVRNPLDGLDRVVPGPGLVGVLVVLVGSTGFDGLSRTLWWARAVDEGVVTGTLGLAATALAVGVIYLLGCAAITPERAHEGHRPGPAAFATTLVPIAAGYALAHYFSLLLFDGQQTLILAGDPFGTGLDLLGTAGTAIDYGLLGTKSIMVVQLLAIVAGHLVASLAAHDRAVRMYPTADALRTQYPMLTAMVALTIGAVGLLFAA